jgi:CBS-domain-containing membrane protein
MAWDQEQTTPTDDCRLSAKLVPTFADIGRHMVSVMNSYGHILGFVDQSRYFFFSVSKTFLNKQDDS